MGISGPDLEFGKNVFRHTPKQHFPDLTNLAETVDIRAIRLKDFLKDGKIDFNDQLHIIRTIAEVEAEQLRDGDTVDLNYSLERTFVWKVNNSYNLGEMMAETTIPKADSVLMQHAMSTNLVQNMLALALDCRPSEEKAGEKYALAHNLVDGWASRTTQDRSLRNFLAELETISEIKD